MNKKCPIVSQTIIQNNINLVKIKLISSSPNTLSICQIIFIFILMQFVIFFEIYIFIQCTLETSLCELKYIGWKLN